MLKEQLHRNMPQLAKADIHIHSNYSDGIPRIEEILNYVQNKTDLSVIAITDHDTIDGAKRAVEIAKKKKFKFDIIVGEEVSSSEGHILGLFLTEMIQPGLSAKETMKKIHDQGGIVVAAHPMSQTRMKNGGILWARGIGTVSLIKNADLIDGIETVNATPTYGEENLKARYLNRTLLFKAETGGSDAHIVDAIGKGFTLFEGKNAEDLREAIEDNQTQAFNQKWDLLGLFRYAYFFYPKGVRVAYNTLIHGRRKKREEIIKFPSKRKLKKELKHVTEPEEQLAK